MRKNKKLPFVMYTSKKQSSDWIQQWPMATAEERIELLIGNYRGAMLKIANRALSDYNAGMFDKARGMNFDWSPDAVQEGLINAYKFMKRNPNAEIRTPRAWIGKIISKEAEKIVKAFYITDSAKLPRHFTYPSLKRMADDDLKELHKIQSEKEKELHKIQSEREKEFNEIFASIDNDELIPLTPEEKLLFGSEGNNDELVPLTSEEELLFGSEGGNEDSVKTFISTSENIKPSRAATLFESKGGLTEVDKHRIELIIAARQEATELYEVMRETLKQEEYELLISKFIQGEKYSTISKRTNKPIGTLKATANRSIHKLRQAYKEREAIEDI